MSFPLSARPAGAGLLQALAGASAISLLLMTAACSEQGDAPETETSEAGENPGSVGSLGDGAGEETDGGTAAGEEAPGTAAGGARFDPESVHVLVNRNHPLGEWEPQDLRRPEVPALREITLRDEAATALEEMFDAAAEDGIGLSLTSGYRSYQYQIEVYAEAHERLGTEGADEYYARPGYSEHQSGLAADVHDPGREDCILSVCFAGTEAGQWVAEHAHEFGFIIRYPEGAEDVTGYQYEPWHLRYLGAETAREVADSGLTLEEHWGEDQAAEYPQDEPIPGIQG